MNDLHPQDDFSTRYFVWHEWIQAYGPLTVDNVSDYFATSMFYDKQSNNQVLRMQTMHTGTAIVNEAEELRRFTGIEFAVVHAQPPSLFIIHKRERFSPDEVRPLAAYFVVNNRIYQSPDVYNLVSNRLLTTIHSLQASLETIRDHRPDFTPRLGFIWPIIDTAMAGTASDSRDDGARRRQKSTEPVEDPSDRRSVSQQRGASVSLDQAGAQHAQLPRKQTNVHPLFWAMNTTAEHTQAILGARMIDVQVPTPEAPAAPIPATSGGDMISTPPAAPPVDGPAPTASHPIPGAKGQPGAGKKKRRRLGLPPPGPT